jgi:hypothetical protein
MRQIDVKQFVKHVSMVATAFAMTVLASSSAQAQSKMDVSAGYQFANFMPSGGTGVNFPYGWYVDVSGTVHPMWALVGEATGVYKSQTGGTLNEYSYQGGVRFFSAVTPMLTPYGQVLIGGATAGGGGGSSVSAFSLQAGGGLNVKVADPVAVRVAVDYRRVFFSDVNGGGQNGVRVALGVVIPF